MLLSGGDDKLVMKHWIEASMQNKFQLHAFDLHAELNAERFKCISDAGVVGAYYHCVPNTINITEAFTAFVGGLKSVVATSVKVTLSGESVVDVDTGGHFWDREQKIIHIADMHACEHKAFIVYLQNSSSSALLERQEELRLAVNVEYLEGSTKKTAMQPCLLHNKDITIARHSDDVVAPEMARFELVKQVRGSVVLGNKTTEEHVKLMSARWEAIKQEYSSWSSSGVLKLIKEDVDELLDIHDQARQQAYVVSWLSCHWWQRATCTVSQSRYSSAFIKRSQESRKGFFAWCGSLGWRPRLVVGVASLLLFFFFFVVLFRPRLLFGGWWPTDQRIALNVTGLEVARHPEWSAMQGELREILGRAEQKKITSFFDDKRASAVDMNQQIDQYLYRVRT